MDQQLAALHYVAAGGGFAGALDELFKLFLLRARLEFFDAVGDLADVELGAGSGLEVLLTGGGGLGLDGTHRSHTERDRGRAEHQPVHILILRNFDS